MIFYLGKAWAFLFILLYFILPVGGFGQELKGQITDEEDNPLLGAWVSWPGTTTRVATAANGEFEIVRPDTSEIYLVAGCRGFRTDTFVVEKKTFAYIELILLAKELADVHIVRKKQGSFIANDQTVKTEVITQKELTKAACCDMAGCFETQGTVQPQTTNVITNAKELRILGLSGVYNQVLMDGLPMVQGLTYTYGISSLPASLIDKIYVAKGANSVLQGFEGISGQINVVTRNPEKEPVLYANGYVNNFGEQHINANYATPVGFKKKWTTLLGLHMVQPANMRDRDNDGFLDLPLLTRYSAFNRWNYGRENEAGWFTHISFRATKEQRTGGQRTFDPATGKGSTRAYGQTLDYFQPEFIAKTGYRFSARHALQSQISAFGQRQDSWFGTLKYVGNQQNVNALLQHQWRYTEENTLTWGASFRYQKLDETISFSDTLPTRSYAGRYQTYMQVPGLFAEHTRRFFDDKLTWIAGLRVDRHQDFGTYFTPRSMVKFDFSPNHTFRGSVGTGWRQVNLFSENITLLASSRDVVFEEKLRPEEALNWGLNYTWMLDKKAVSGTFSADFFQTRFQNQFFPDFEQTPGKAYIRNFTGTSVSNSLQLETNLKFYEEWEWKTVYNYVEVYRMEKGDKRILPFNPINRVMMALSYRPNSDWFYLDLNTHWFDRQRLPATQNLSGEAGPQFSNSYATFNAQLTVKWKTLEVYGGVENLFDFRQRQPIVGWQNPFGPNFDTSTVWGPTRGRETYLGLRWKLERKQKDG